MPPESLAIWQYRGDSDPPRKQHDIWITYFDSAFTRQLESSFASGQGDVRVDDQRLVDLKTMYQRRYDNRNRKRRVRRREVLREGFVGNRTPQHSHTRLLLAEL